MPTTTRPVWSNRWPIWPAALLLVGCGIMSSNATTTRRPDGSYEITCKVSLSRCLEQAEELCPGGTYQVLLANNQRESYGPEGLVRSDVRSSSAVIRCARQRSLFGAKEDGPPAGGMAPRSGACVPGATQTCFGAGACRGGQSCASDGTRFLPCDCAPAGAASTSPAAPPDAAVGSDR